MSKDWVVMDRWMDGWMERVKKREKGDGDETRCGLEGGQEGPSVTGKEMQ